MRLHKVEEGRTKGGTTACLSSSPSGGGCTSRIGQNIRLWSIDQSTFHDSPAHVLENLHSKVRICSIISPNTNILHIQIGENDCRDASILFVRSFRFRRVAIVRAKVSTIAHTTFLAFFAIAIATASTRTWRTPKSN